MNVATEEVTLYEVIQAALDSRQMDINVAMPAKVQSYNAGSQTVTVIPQLNRHLQDGDGNIVPETLPALADVPVCFPRNGSYFISFPIQSGDYVMLVFAQKNLANWRATGSQGD